jgi:SpoVK/Ycf46/Vps4 family AAA+-type ATPase
VGQAAGQVAASKEEERLRQLILGEVLDRTPNVTFADVADLATAKQALQEAVILPR